MKSIAIIGGGVAGLEAATNLSRMGFSVTVIEEKDQPGGKLNQWHALFPNRRPAAEVLASLKNHAKLGINMMLNTRVENIEKNDDGFALALNHNRMITAHAVLLATGFELFDASKKEEYGYGIYDNVITSVDLEQAFEKGIIKTAEGKIPKKIGFIHCVGSRDEKAGNPHCSKVCCITGVKQAIELKERIPDSEIFMFYMDLRMFGRHFEELYKEAQVKGVNFIRGRLSEANETRTHQVIIKAEDTLVSRPLQLTVDLVVLMSGMSPAKSALPILESLGLNVNDDGFACIANAHTGSTLTHTKGVFVAGACSGPANITDSVNEARAAALQIHQYLNGGALSSLDSE